MTVNALIAARLIERDRSYRTGERVTTSYVMTAAGVAALDAS
jgi:hypothetical protein